MRQQRRTIASRHQAFDRIVVVQLNTRHRLPSTTGEPLRGQARKASGVVIQNQWLSGQPVGGHNLRGSISPVKCLRIKVRQPFSVLHRHHLYMARIDVVLHQTRMQLHRTHTWRQQPSLQGYGQYDPLPKSAIGRHNWSGGAEPGFDACRNMTPITVWLSGLKSDFFNTIGQKLSCNCVYEFEGNSNWPSLRLRLCTKSAYASIMLR